MKNRIYITLILLIFSKYLVAQNTIIDFQNSPGAVTKTVMDYNFERNKFSATKDSKASVISMGISSQVYKFVYIRSEFGVATAQDNIDFTYSGDLSGANGDIRWSGVFQSSRAFVSFCPEVRILKGLIYINGGFLIAKDLTNGFVRGEQRINNDFTDLTGQPMSSPTISTGSTLAFGINPTYKNVGFKLGFKFMNLSPIGVNDSNPNIGFSTAHVLIGISHTIK